LSAFDLIIAIEKNASVVVRQLGAPESKLQVWPIHDPWGGDLTEYERVAPDIWKRLSKLKQTAAHEA
jgi:protein-tyrosine-phosphatase